MKTKKLIYSLLLIGLTSTACSTSASDQSSSVLNARDALVEPVVVITPLLTSSVGTVLPDLSKVDFVGIAREQYGQCGEHRALALSVGWPESEWKNLSMIMRRESNCMPTAWSGSDAGLMQINRIHTEWASQMGLTWPDDLFNARHNLMFAYRLWETSGWRPWRFSGEIPE